MSLSIYYTAIITLEQLGTLNKVILEIFVLLITCVILNWFIIVLNNESLTFICLIETKVIQI